MAGGEGAVRRQVFGFGAGVVLPGGLLFGVDDSTERHPPGVVLLALGEHRSDVVLS
jgi:hypothetical protein